MLNLLVIHRALDPCGGVPRSFVNLATGSKGLPMKFHFASLETVNENFKAELTKGAHKVVVFSRGGRRGGLGTIPKITRYIREHKIDLIFACCFRAYFLAKVATVFSPRVVYWARGAKNLLVKTHPKSLKILLFRILLNRGWFLSNSFYTLYSYVPKTRPRSIVVYNGVNSLPITPKKNAREVLNIPHNAKVLTNASEYSYFKDHRTLITAFQRLASKRRDLYLLLCGRWTSDEMNSLKKDLVEDIVGESEIVERISLLGPRQDMPLILSATDIYVHPCYMEAFGNIVAEAMMVGVPVVAANAGALPEVVNDAGLLFEPQNPDSLANAVETLLSDRDLNYELSEKGRLRAKQEFSSLSFAKRLFRVSEKILRDLETG